MFYAFPGIYRAEILFVVPGRRRRISLGYRFIYGFELFPVELSGDLPGRRLFFYQLQRIGVWND